MNDFEQLVGLRATVRLNDFVDRTLPARIHLVQPATNSVLLEFDSPCEVQGVQYSRAVASSRLQRDNLDTFLNSGVLGAAVTWIPDSRFEHSAPFDTSWWRGGGAAIADIVLASGAGD